MVSFISNDLREAIWTAGTYTEIDDPWNDDTAGQFGASDFLRRSAVLPVNATEFHGYIWVKYPTSKTVTGSLVKQLTGNNGIEVTLTSSGDIDVVMTQSTGNFTLTRITDAGVPGSEFVHIAYSGKAIGSGDTETHFVVNGVEPSYSLHDFKIGTGFTDIQNTTFYILSNGSHTLDLTRTKLADTFATVAELIALYDAELDALPVVSSGIKGGEGRPDFRLDLIRQTRYNRGLPRFIR